MGYSQKPGTKRPARQNPSPLADVEQVKNATRLRSHPDFYVGGIRSWIDARQLHRSGVCDPRTTPHIRGRPRMNRLPGYLQAARMIPDAGTGSRRHVALSIGAPAHIPSKKVLRHTRPGQVRFAAPPAVTLEGPDDGPTKPVGSPLRAFSPCPLGKRRAQKRTSESPGSPWGPSGSVGPWGAGGAGHLASRRTAGASQDGGEEPRQVVPSSRRPAQRTSKRRTPATSTRGG